MKLTEKSGFCTNLSWRWVLTAAHCLRHKIKTRASFGIDSDGEFAYTTTVPSSNQHIHPLHNRTTTSQDIGEIYFCCFPKDLNCFDAELCFFSTILISNHIPVKCKRKQLKPFFQINTSFTWTAGANYDRCSYSPCSIDKRVRYTT